MTTRIELEKALATRGFLIVDSDHPHYGPITEILNIRAYNIASSWSTEPLAVEPGQLMGWHRDDHMIHISTVGCEFIVEDIRAVTTEHLAERISRFVTGTYFAEIVK